MIGALLGSFGSSAISGIGGAANSGLSAATSAATQTMSAKSQAANLERSVESWMNDEAQTEQAHAVNQNMKRVQSDRYQTNMLDKMSTQMNADAMQRATQAYQTLSQAAGG